MSTATKDTAVAKIDTKALMKTKVSSGSNVQALLESYRSAFEAAAPQHLDVNRMLRIAIMSVSRNKDLLECTGSSLLGAFMASIQTGLDIGMGLAHLVPFRNNKTNQREVQFIPDYKGLIQLAQNTGKVTAMWAVVVYNDDYFIYQEGLDRKLEHRPAGRSLNPHDLHAVYSIARFTDGFQDCEVMFKNEIDAIKASAKSQTGPWSSPQHYFEMAKKTVIKRHCKRLPKSVESVTAIALDDRAAMGRPQNIGLIELPDGRATIDVPAMDTDEDHGQDGGDTPSPPKNTGKLSMSDLKEKKEEPKDAAPANGNGEKGEPAPAPESTDSAQDEDGSGPPKPGGKPVGASKQKKLIDAWEGAGCRYDDLAEWLKYHSVPGGSIEKVNANQYDYLMKLIGRGEVEWGNGDE